MWWYLEVGPWEVIMNGTSALMKETPEAAGPAIMGGYSRKIAVSMNQEIGSHQA
jgi:hypothetical protein